MHQIGSDRRRSSVMGYEQSLMFGHYREQLSNFALIQAQKAKQLEEERQKTDTKKKNVSKIGNLKEKLNKIVENGGDWILLSILGSSVALLSFIMDLIIHMCFDFRNWLTTEITKSFAYNYLLWIAFTVTTIMISSIFVRLISLQSAGSGVSEMKVILRGVVLKEYLSCRTLIAKVFCLPFVLGSGLPLGKEGPYVWYSIIKLLANLEIAVPIRFVHISAMIANHLMKFFGTIKSPLEYDSRFLEVIAVACAVGVAATFAAPVGGVLYSIEIVSVFFAVRSYWLGFFAATVGALLWRLLTVWFRIEENITHVFKTEFRKEQPYETLELISFGILGALCGLSAFAFVTIQKHIVLFNRRKTAFHIILQKYPLIYPALVTTLIAIVSYPQAFGQYYASWLSSEESMHELFSNFTWGDISDKIDKDDILDNWRTEKTSIFVNTFLFYVMNLLVVALGSTLPVPCGLIIPSFKIGAGLGRFFGEWMAYFFPRGINPYYDRTKFPIIAGAYAVAGSAAFAGANTGAMSSAVIAFEVTGQVTHLLPIIVAVIVATMISQRLGPSIYDSLIKLKNLPYLPSIIQSSSGAHRIFVQDFMESDILYVWEGCSYRYLRHLLNAKRHLNIYPFVKSPDSLLLLGTVERIELEILLENHLNKDRMIDDLKSKSTQSLTQYTSPNCPIHGHQRFQVSTVPENDTVDTTAIEKHIWEEKQLDFEVDFTCCPIDTAPFQLVEGTSLMKAHSLFSLLGLQIAYVTALGTLIGVVSLKEMRRAIEQMNSGVLPIKKTDASIESQPLKE